MLASRVQTVGFRQTNYRESRPGDYLYDPIYCVSGVKDHNASCMAAFQQSAECAVCPVYNSMFTDLSTLPKTIATVRFGNVSTNVDMSWPAKQRTMAQQFQESKTVDIDGVDRHRYFRRPLVPFMNPILPPLHYSADKTTLVEASLQLSSKTAVTSSTHGLATLKPPALLPETMTQATQTDYRESSAQTDPWDTPYVIKGDTTPEIISLAHLSWKKGLPAGMHEIEIIERARIRRAWECTLPPVTDLGAADTRRRIVEAIERDEWAFREAEIEHINELRLDLAKRLLGEKLGELGVKNEERVAKYKAQRYEHKDKKVAMIRHDTTRALRKLHLKHIGVTAKYRKKDVIEEHADRNSEWYGPQMRFGQNPRRAHLDIHCDPRYFNNLKTLDMVEKVPKMLPGYAAIRFAAPTTSRSYELCIRETRWTEDKLKCLHDDLKEIRMKRQQGPAPLRLLKRVPKAVERCSTPTIEGVPDWEEDVFEAAVLLQKIIRGRAIQTMMYKGMNKCSELIEELRSTHALHEAGMEQRAEERFEVMSQQRAHQLINMKRGALEETLGSLEGEAIAETLDFFSKELWRLQDERRVHAFALLAERERHRREALEAGRRQVEERRRKEHDELFKQIMKVHQDTVDIYLEDLIVDSMAWVADSEARQYVRDLAKRVDEAAHEAHVRQDCIEQEEIIADLVHNFVMPEVQKQMVRQKMKRRQERYLCAAHDAIYGTPRQQAVRPAGYNNKRQSSVVPSTAAAVKAQQVAANELNTVPQFSGEDLSRSSGESALIFSSFRTPVAAEGTVEAIVTNSEVASLKEAQLVLGEAARETQDTNMSSITVDTLANTVGEGDLVSSGSNATVNTFLEIKDREVDIPRDVEPGADINDKGESGGEHEVKSAEWELHQGRDEQRDHAVDVESLAAKGGVEEDENAAFDVDTSLIDEDPNVDSAVTTELASNGESPAVKEVVENENDAPDIESSQILKEPMVTTPVIDEEDENFGDDEENSTIAEEGVKETTSFVEENYYVDDYKSATEEEVLEIIQATDEKEGSEVDDMSSKQSDSFLDESINEN